MAGALYSVVRLVCNTVYPAYKSFKAVKSKSVRDYVRWMMYWIVFAAFTTLETILDPFMVFWFPFYSELKLLLLLYLVSPVTKGSGIIYRRFLHPVLCAKETEIDEVIDRTSRQGYERVSNYAKRGVSMVASSLLDTAIKGGGSVLNQLRRTYNMTDISDLAELAFRDEGRFTDVTDQYNDGSSSGRLRRKQQLGGGGGRKAAAAGDFRGSRTRLNMAMSADMIGSTESLSSGYCSDSLMPVLTETMDTQDYELWERRQQIRYSPKNHRKQYGKASLLSDEEDDYESMARSTPFGPLNRSSLGSGAVSPDPASSYYPSDQESDDENPYDLHSFSQPPDQRRRQPPAEHARQRGQDPRLGGQVTPEVQGSPLTARRQERRELPRMKQDPRDREGRATTTTDLTMGRHQERPVVNETRSPAAVRRPAAARQPAAAGGELEEQAQKTRPADSPTTDFTMEDLKLAARRLNLQLVEENLEKEKPLPPKRSTKTGVDPLQGLDPNLLPQPSNLPNPSVAVPRDSNTIAAKNSQQQDGDQEIIQQDGAEKDKIVISNAKEIVSAEKEEEKDKFTSKTYLSYQAKEKSPESSDSEFFEPEETFESPNTASQKPLEYTETDNNEHEFLDARSTSPAVEIVQNLQDDTKPNMADEKSVKTTENDIKVKTISEPNILNNVQVEAQQDQFKSNLGNIESQIIYLEGNEDTSINAENKGEDNVKENMIVPIKETIQENQEDIGEKINDPEDCIELTNEAHELPAKVNIATISPSEDTSSNIQSRDEETSDKIEIATTTSVKQKSIKKTRAPPPPLDDTNPFLERDDDDTVNEDQQSDISSRESAPLSSKDFISRLVERKKDDFDEVDGGTVLYRSPGYPGISRSPLTPDIRLQRSLSPLLDQSADSQLVREPPPSQTDQLIIREKPVPFPTPTFSAEDVRQKTASPTRIITTSREGITRLRTYVTAPEDQPEDEVAGHEPGASGPASKCPHCTIHTWLPHSPSCPKIKKK